MSVMRLRLCIALLVSSMIAGSAMAQSIPVPISYYSFDEAAGATTVADSIRGPAGTGTLFGYSSGGTFGAGIIGNALSFDGTSQYVTAPLAGQGLSEATVSSWVRLNSSTQWSTIVKNWGNTQVGAWHLGLLSNDQQWSNFVGLTDGSAVSVVDPATVSFGQWYYIATTVSALDNEAFLYVNGVRVGSNTFNGTIAQYGSLMSFAAKLNDAQNAADLTEPGYLDGDLDELAFWDSALTPGDITAVYNAGLNGQSLIPVPEPSTVALGAIGLTTIGVWCYRRRLRSTRG